MRQPELEKILPDGDEALDARVERERAAHTEDDVLAKSHRLKDRFPHIRHYPSLERLHGEMARLSQAVDGLCVLDLGCGKGERSLELLKHGARVCGIDISVNYVAECEQVALKAGFDPNNFEFRAMDAHRLEYPDNMFDLVIGDGILHHLDLQVSTNELLRVLKPGGRMLFKEPLLDNPLLVVFRLLTPHARTPDEKPLSRADLARLAANPAWRIESSYCGLICAPVAMFTSIVLRRWPQNWLLRMADWVESPLTHVKWLAPWHQYVLLNLVKQSAN